MNGVLRPLLQPATAITAVAFALLVGFGPKSTDDIQELLRVRIEAAQNGAPEALEVAERGLHAEDALIHYYQQEGFRPAWVGSRGPVRLADLLLKILREADRDGLRPADYHVTLIDSLLSHLRNKAGAGEPLDPRRLTDFELLCTDAFLLYGAHLRTGRVDPAEVIPSFEVTQPNGDVVEQLRRAVGKTSVRTAFSRLRAPQPEYATLRRALARYRQLEQQGGWPTLPHGPKLEAGVEDPRVPALRWRLRLTGDLHTEGSATDSLLYDEQLARGVSDFQERHGLDADGVVGPATRAALDVPASARVEQIRVNMERWRWLPRDLGNPHVVVNIAGFWLGVVEDGTTALRMRVISGQPYRQTPVFSGEISYLVFSPYWHVPHTIAVEDKLPEFKKNADVVSKLGYEVLQGWGAGAQTIEPTSIDWSAYSQSNFPYRLRQRPGPQNALGRVKFMFPNPHSVYLHDTPSTDLFDRAQRSFSSGCIRVEKPQELAQFLLGENEGWTPERIRDAMAQRTERTVVLIRKVPVHLLYWTAWSEAGDAVHFRKDVYDRDGAVLAALNHPFQSLGTADGASGE